MALARLWCTFLFLYNLQLQVITAQQSQGSNQNNGFNNGMSLQQQAMQKINSLNSLLNQNGGFNYNLPQQTSVQHGSQQANYQTSNSQQSNKQNLSQPAYSQQGNNLLQRAINWQGGSQQPSNTQTNNFQPQSASVPGGMQMVRPIKQTATEMSNSMPVSRQAQGRPSPYPESVSSYQMNNGGFQQNFQGLQQNSGLSNIAPSLLSQFTNVPASTSFYPPTSPLAEIGALKNQPSILSLMGPQNNSPLQQNQDNFAQSGVLQQNSLTDYQKQILVKTLQQPISSKNQQAFGYVQNQPRLFTTDSPQIITVQGQPAPQMQPIVTQLGTQPAFIPVQAQPLTAYLQNQPNYMLPQPLSNYVQSQPQQTYMQGQPQQIYMQSQPQQTYVQTQPQTVDEDSSLLSLILSEFPQSSPHYALASAYMPKKGSKTSLKSLIPLIINLIKERNNCGCRNCRCQNSECNNNNIEAEPSIFSGYSNQMNYSPGTEDCSQSANNSLNATDNMRNREDTHIENNVVNVDSREVSDEDVSDYVDDEEP